MAFLGDGVDRPPTTARMRLHCGAIMEMTWQNVRLSPTKTKQKSCGGRGQTTAARVAQEAAKPLCLGKPNSGLRYIFRFAEDCLFQSGYGEAPTNSSKLVAGELCVAHVSRVPRTAPPASTERLP